MFLSRRLFVPILAAALLLAVAFTVQAESVERTDPEFVTSIQRLLTTLGYDPGPIDAKLGPRTRGAIGAFQHDNGHPVTGRATTLTLVLLVAAVPEPTGAADRNKKPRFPGVPVDQPYALDTPDGADWTWQAVGPARVIDGDTLEVKGALIDLYGIDAPETQQTCQTTDGIPWACGVGAAITLRNLIDGQEVKCFGDDRGSDRQGHQVAICHVWGVSNLNSDMLRLGWVLNYREDRIYAMWEQDARKNMRGIWSGFFDPPWQWRRDNAVPEQES